MLGLGNTLSGGIVPAAASFGDEYSIQLDGTNYYVTTGTVGGSNSQDYTFSWWMRASSTSENKNIFNHGSGGGFSIQGFWLNQGGTRPYLECSSGGHNRRWNDISSQDDDAWHHWMLFIDASAPSGCTLFVDGSEVSVQGTNEFGTAPTWGNLEIGRDKYSNYGAYYIGDFAVFTGDKTGDASDHYNDGSPKDLSGEDNLHLYYKWEEGTGTTVEDSSSNSNDGTLVNSPTWSSSTP